MSAVEQDLLSELESKQELDTVDFLTYEQDFCCKIASFVAPEYTSLSKINEIIQLIIGEKRKTLLISLILRLFNLVCKNKLLNTQLQSVYAAYQKEAHEQRGHHNRFDIERNCIKIFGDLPSAVELVSQIYKEFTNVFDSLSDKDFSEIFKIFTRDSFVESILQSSLHIWRDPEKFNEQFFHLPEQSIGEIGSATQHIIWAIAHIRDALNLIFKKRDYSLVTATGSLPDRISAVDANHPSFKVDTFLLSYLKEIFNNNRISDESSAADDLFKNQTIRIPLLIQAMQQTIKPFGRPEMSIWPENMARPLIPELERNVLSMVQHLGTKSPHVDLETLEFEESQHVTERMLITSSRFHRSQGCKIKCPKKHEEFAALFDRVPLVEAVNDSAIRASILKFLRLYPGAIKTFGPHLIWVELSAYLMGAIAATDAILNPNASRLSFRFWKATTNGAVLLVFSLGAAINFYLSYHPEEQNISDELFFKEIASAPLGLMIMHTLWHMISPLQKEKLFPRGTCYYALRLGLDLGFKTLYNAGVLLFAATTFFNLPKTLLFQLLPIIPSAFVSAGQLFSPFKEKLTTLMTYLTCSVFASSLIKSSLPSSPDRSFEGNLQIILRTTVLTSLGVYSCAIVAKGYLNFLNEYINEDTQAAEIIARRIVLPVNDGRPDLSLYQEQGDIIDMRAYHELEQDIKEKRTEDAHRKTLLFSQKAKGSQQSIPRNAQLLTADIAETKPRKSSCGNCVIL